MCRTLQVWLGAKPRFFSFTIQFTEAYPSSLTSLPHIVLTRCQYLFGFTTLPLFETKQCQLDFLVPPRAVGWLRVYKGDGDGRLKESVMRTSTQVHSHKRHILRSVGSHPASAFVMVRSCWLHHLRTVMHSHSCLATDRIGKAHRRKSERRGHRPHYTWTTTSLHVMWHRR